MIYPLLPVFLTAVLGALVAFSFGAALALVSAILLTLLVKEKG